MCEVDPAGIAFGKADLRRLAHQPITQRSDQHAALMTDRTLKRDRKGNDPWPEAAQQLTRLAAQRGKQLGSAEQLQQLDAVCATISALCDTHPSPAAVESHKLLQLLGTVLSKVLDQGNHRKWRQAAYAERVCCLMQTLFMVLCMARMKGAGAVMSVVATRVSSQLSESGVLPKLAVAVQEVAAMLSAANKRAVGAAATAGPSQFDQQQTAGTQLAADMLPFPTDVLLLWPGGVLGSAVAGPLAAPAAQLAHAVVSTIQQRWEASSGGQQQQQQQLQEQVAVQQELTVCVMLSQLLMRLLHAADWENMDQQPHSLQLLRAPQYHQLLLLLLAVRAQQLHEPTADNSASSACAGTIHSQLMAAIAGSNSTSSSSSSSSSGGTSSGGTSSSTSGSGQQTMQQQPASSITAAGQKQQLPYQLQLWQSLGLPQQLLGVISALRLSKPCEISLLCDVLSKCLEELVLDNPSGRFVSHDELSPSQMAVARLHQPVPMLLLESAAAFISNTSLVISCANTAARSVHCWKLVLDEQLAKEADVQGQSGAAAQGISTAAVQLPVRELQQLVVQLFKQLMQQPEAAGKPEPQQQQQAKAASSSSQRIAEQQQQQPGYSTDVTHALTALVRVLQSLLHLPVEFYLSWQGVSAVLQTFVRNLLSCRSSKDVVATKQEAAVQIAEFNQVIDSLCIQHGSQEPGQLVRAAAAAAAGGAEQLQLFGLLLSTIKLWHSHMLHLVGARGEEVLPSAESVLFILNLGLAAHHMLASLAPAAAGAAGSSAGAPAAGSSGAGVGVVQPAVQLVAVPWLVLQARCLYLAGVLLHKQAAWKPTGGPDDPGPCFDTNADYAAQRVIPAVIACLGGAAAAASRVATYLRSSCCSSAPAAGSSSSGQAGNAGTCTSAASSSSDSRQQADVPSAQAGVLTAPPAATPSATTTAPGTVGCELQQELLSLAEALLQGVEFIETSFMGLMAVGQEPGAKVLNLLQQLQQGPGRLEELSGQLMALGAAVGSQLPTPCCCNNPGCTNMAMPSEQQLVGGKGCICAGCQVARYCGKECQTAHWKQHRPVCRRISKR